VSKLKDWSYSIDIVVSKCANANRDEIYLWLGNATVIVIFLPWIRSFIIRG